MLVASGSKLEGMIRMTNVIRYIRNFPYCNIIFIRVACSKYSDSEVRCEVRE